MSLLSRLFGGKSKDAGPNDAQSQGIDYGGFTIHPEPIREGKVWRLAARIRGEVEGSAREHHLIRADTLESADAAAEAAIAKAKQMIDEQGARVFD